MTEPDPDGDGEAEAEAWRNISNVHIIMRECAKRVKKTAYICVKEGSTVGESVTKALIVLQHVQYSIAEITAAVAAG